MGYERLAAAPGDAGAVEGGREVCVWECCTDGCGGGGGGCEVTKGVWRSTPNASEMEGSDCLGICLALSRSCSRAGGVRAVCWVPAQLFACIADGGGTPWA